MTLELQGDTFSPSEAERLTGLSLVRKVEPGEIGERGRYRGQPTPYGAAALAVPEAVPEEQKLEWLLTVALEHLSTFRRLGADEPEVYATYAYDAQCNLSYSSSELEKLARLSLPFCVSCYRDESQFEQAVPTVAG